MDNIEWTTRESGKRLKAIDYRKLCRVLRLKKYLCSIGPLVKRYCNTTTLPCYWIEIRSVRISDQIEWTWIERLVA